MTMKLVFLSALFVMLFVLSNIISVKIIELWTFILPAGIITFSLTFLITDVINEVWGAETAKKLVVYGFLIMGVALGAIHLAIYFPPAPFWIDYQEAFATLFGGAFRITLGSFCAYLVSQFHDIWAFGRWRRMTGGKHLWLRNNASTIISQLIDSAIFIGIAFVGIFPSFNSS